MLARKGGGDREAGKAFKMSDKARFYVSLPVDMLTCEQMEKLQAEVAGVLDLEAQEPVFNRAALNGDDPQRMWKHLSEAMILLGGCSGVIFSPGWNGFGQVCSVVFEVAIRAGKRCLYTYRDSSGTLRLLNVGHCGGPEKREEEDL